MNSIKNISMNPCKKCGDELHYPSQLHTVFDGHKFCKCLGHEYSDCIKPWQRKKVSYEQYKEPDNINREPIIEECTEGCTTYSTYCEYNHN